MALSAPELLTTRHDLTRFSCGQPALDHWLKTRALANQEKGFTVVMVVHDALRVVGYYGLAPTAVVATALPRRIRTGQPPDPVPCLLLGQLATDTAYAGRGIGNRPPQARAQPRARRRPPERRPRAPRPRPRRRSRRLLATSRRRMTRSPSSARSPTSPHRFNGDC